MNDALSGSITVLVENSVSRADLLAEHGLAFWVDLGDRCILFDTGQSGLIASNAGKLRIDLDAVDTVALSHGHYDHCGGLAEVLARAAGDVCVYAHPDALLTKCHRMATGIRSIGMPGVCLNAMRSARVKLCAVTSPTEIAPSVWLTGEIPRRFPEEPGDGSFCRDAAGEQVDLLRDDQALYLNAAGGTVVLLGCAHSGVINILDYIWRLTEGRPFLAVMGGMHLHSASGERLAWTVDALGKFPIQKFFPAHCTGSAACAAMWSAFPGRCMSCGVGTVLGL